MANQIATGMGSICFYEPVKKFVFPCPPMRFQITTDSESVQSLKFVNGILVTAGSLQKSANYNLELAFQASSWLLMQFIFGEYEQIIDPKGLTEPLEGYVPKTAPYEVSVPKLQTAVGALTISEDVGSGATKVKQGQRTVAATPATPAVGSFGIDLASKKIIFNAADAGAPFMFRYLRDYTAIRSLGAGPSPVRFETFSFSGIGYLGDDKVKIEMPTVSRAGLPDFGFTGDVGEFVTQNGIIPAVGQSLPFQVYMLSDLLDAP